LFALTTAPSTTLIEKNGLPTHFNIVNGSIFLGERLESVTLFKIPKNDVNKVHKEIAVEFLSLAGSGKPKDGLRFFCP
jgi:hypothetical protein